MKNLKLFLLFIIVSAFFQNASAQSKLSGKVVEVVDGKTAVVQIGTSGKLTVILQYVEIPEPEQQFHSVVKEHLGKLINGKSALVVPRGVVESKTVAQVFVDGVDISQQMIRDGAAWFALPEKTEKSGAETATYISNEGRAKAEKRGIWSIEGLQPAWEFRAAKAERERARELAVLEEIKQRSQIQKAEKKKLPPPPAVFSNFEMWKAGRTAGMWDDIQMYMGDQQFNEKGLFVYKMPSVNMSFIMTKDTQLNLANGDSRPKIICGAAYVKGKARDKNGEEKEFFGMGCRMESDKQNFKQANQLTFVNDGKKMTYKSAAHLGQQADKRFNEMVIYILDRNAFMKIASADNVEMKIGNYSGTMSSKFHSMIKELVIESANEIK